MTTNNKVIFDTPIKVENLIKFLSEELKKRLGDTPLEPYNLHIILKYVMEAIENTALKGVEQKEVAIKLIRDLLNMYGENDEKKKAIITLLDNGTIGNMIDLIVDATKGRLNVNNLKKVGTNCLGVCFPLLCME